ncbi:MAG: Fur family transcriptional regulator [Oscillospiraceae bacterium]
MNWPEGLKKTKPRRQVMAQLEQAEHPLGAQEIESRLAAAGTSMWLSTVYRVLEDFVEHGLVRRVELMERGVAAYELAGEEHRHYAVCLSCHGVTPLECCPLEHAATQVGEGFQVMGHQVQMYGYCADCCRKRSGNSAK